MNSRSRVSLRQLFLALAVTLAATSIGAPLATAAESYTHEDIIDHPQAQALLRGLPAPQTVTIPWRPGRFNEFKMGSVEEGLTRTHGGNLIGQIYRAPGLRPAPYAVLLAGCGGTYGGVNGLWLQLWARALQDLGIGTLALDSIEARGVPDDVCGDGSKVWAQRRVDAAHAALAWLANQPRVDSRRIVVMGMSNGGRAALLSVSATESARFHRFAAAVALYPTCDRLPPHELLAPALLLFGGSDESATPEQCERFIVPRRNALVAPRIKVYPQADHLFDVYPRNEDYTVPEVVESRADVMEFLRQALSIAKPTTHQTAASPHGAAPATTSPIAR